MGRQHRVPGWRAAGRSEPQGQRTQVQPEAQEHQQERAGKYDQLFPEQPAWTVLPSRSVWPKSAHLIIPRSSSSLDDVQAQQHQRQGDHSQQQQSQKATTSKPQDFAEQRGAGPQVRSPSHAERAARAAVLTAYTADMGTAGLLPLWGSLIDISKYISNIF